MYLAAHTWTRRQNLFSVFFVFNSSDEVVCLLETKTKQKKTNRTQTELRGIYVCRITYIDSCWMIVTITHMHSYSKHPHSHTHRHTATRVVAHIYVYDFAAYFLRAFFCRCRFGLIRAKKRFVFFLANICLCEETLSEFRIEAK